MGTAFGLGWGLVGLWTGPVIAVLIQSSLQTTYVFLTDWNRAVEEALARSTSDDTTDFVQQRDI
jgi:multidrug resistance protein, MATE family